MSQGYSESDQDYQERMAKESAAIVAVRLAPTLERIATALENIAGNLLAMRSGE